MTKKGLNQNAKFVQKLRDTIETNFDFSNKPLNRLKIIKNNILDSTVLDLYSGAGSFGLECLCLLYTSPSPRDATLSRMPSSA